jgi:hypothetical protein
MIILTESKHFYAALLHPVGVCVGFMAVNAV